MLVTSVMVESSPNTKITISGLSSGAAMAVQFHVIWSSFVEGAAVIAGAPYYCSKGDYHTAVTACTTHPNLISVPELISDTNFAYAARTIDDPRLLANTKVWLYSGKLDSVVVQGVVLKTQSYYNNWINSSRIQTVYNINSEHAFITNNYGNSCTHLGSPFINNCNYDSVGAFLTFIFGKLNSPIIPNPQNIKQLNQLRFIPAVGPDAAALGNTGYVYVPSSCNRPNSGCRLHISFHGCKQTIADIKSDFYLHTGYNGWAEANNFIVFYPQAKATPLNPNGCWDWWGFTGIDYASKLGVQVQAVKNMADYILQVF